MGAGVSSLSKICLVEPCVAQKADDSGATAIADIDYTFVGLGIEHGEVDTAGNCGNMSSAIGPYAYNARLLDPSVYEKRWRGRVTVRVRNTNTDKYIDSTFDVDKGQAVVHGRYAIDGVAGTAAQIKLDFQSPYGSKTGKVLPTGNRIDNILGYKVSCVDGANPGVFVRADDLGVDGTILPNEFNKLPEKLQELERIRKAAAVAMGIAETDETVPRTIPKIGIVSMSSTHELLSGKTIDSSGVDLVVRFISDTQPHRAIPLTLALTTAVAARIPGTIVEQLLAPDPAMEGTITIGHASGRIQVNATMHRHDSITPKSATVYRTAKRIFEGNIFYTGDLSDFATTAQLHEADIRRRHSLGLAFVKEMRGQAAEWL
ncbi:PrpF protein, partial [Lophiotrema nucula]